MQISPSDQSWNDVFILISPSAHVAKAYTGLQHVQVSVELDVGGGRGRGCDCVVLWSCVDASCLSPFLHQLQDLDFKAHASSAPSTIRKDSPLFVLSLDECELKRSSSWTNTILDR